MTVEKLAAKITLDIKAAALEAYEIFYGMASGTATRQMTIATVDCSIAAAATAKVCASPSVGSNGFAGADHQADRSFNSLYFQHAY